MITVRCTQQLLKHLKIKPVPEEELAPTTNALGSYTLKAANVGHDRWVLGISQHGNLPIVLPLKELKNADRSVARAAEFTLLAMHVPDPLIEKELERCEPSSSRQPMIGGTWAR